MVTDKILILDADADKKSRMQTKHSTCTRAYLLILDFLDELLVALSPDLLNLVGVRWVIINFDALVDEHVLCLLVHAVPTLLRRLDLCGLVVFALASASGCGVRLTVRGFEHAGLASGDNPDVSLGPALAHLVLRVLGLLS